jgi:hypothetical protein
LGMTFDTENDVREYYKKIKKHQKGLVWREDLNHFMNYLSQGSFHLGTTWIQSWLQYHMEPVRYYWFPSLYF